MERSLLDVKQDMNKLQAAKKQADNTVSAYSVHVVDVVAEKCRLTNTHREKVSMAYLVTLHTHTKSIKYQYVKKAELSHFSTYTF